MIRGRLVLVVCGWLVLAGAGSSAAQPAASGPAPWRPWRPVVSVGAGWVGADALGAVSAETRATSPGTLTPSPFTLFETDSTLDGAPRGELAIAVPVTSAVALEIVGTLARPTLTTSISGDAESAPTTTASESIDEYTLGARVVYDLTRWSLGGRARPFVAAGGAYLRQLHEDQVLVETGQIWSAGAGLRLWLRGARRGRSLGLTGEIGWSWRTGGITFTGGARGVPTASVRLFAGL